MASSDQDLLQDVCKDCKNQYESESSENLWYMLYHDVLRGCENTHDDIFVIKTPCNF